MTQDEQKEVIAAIRANVLKMLDGRNPHEPISATVVFKVQKAKEDTFRKNADELTAATRKLPGCNLFVYRKHRPFQDEPAEPPNAVEYLIYEDWETVEQFRKQWTSDHIHKFQDGVFDLVVEQPDVTFYEGWQKAGTTSHLPRTGQKLCYSVKGAVIPCAGTGQDGEFQAGMPFPTPRLVDNGNGTVTDRLTNLIWLKNANLFGEVSWNDALAQARKVANGSCGLTDHSKAGDWRLPNINELQSLLDLSNSSGPAIAEKEKFTNLQAANYWSSTSVAAFPSLAWYTALAVGPPVFDLKVNLMHMWPVRGHSTRVARTGQKQCYEVKEDGHAEVIPGVGTGQDGELQEGVPWPDPRFTDNHDGTVTDNLTGLIWLKNGTPFGTRTWEQALQDCNSLASGKYGLADGSKAGDWRLPNINELRSLEDYGQARPALPVDHLFTNVRQSLCWSSTTVTSSPNLARFLFVGIGSCVWDHKNVLMGVWPVKGGR